LSYRRAAEVFAQATAPLAAASGRPGGWTLHQPRHSALTYDAESGTNTPMLLGRSRHASMRSLERYARPGPKLSAPSSDDHNPYHSWSHRVSRPHPTCARAHRRCLTPVLTDPLCLRLAYVGLGVRLSTPCGFATRPRCQGTSGTATPTP
ncbi:MAG: hypothetical protein J2P17_03020, partial [Mycobacterium sp.]|nr:hypothetical protein [Mycobacterium sp.]